LNCGILETFQGHLKIQHWVVKVFFFPRVKVGVVFSFLEDAGSGLGGLRNLGNLLVGYSFELSEQGPVLLAMNFNLDFIELDLHNLQLLDVEVKSYSPYWFAC
jgi:hypothetical protein